MASATLVKFGVECVEVFAVHSFVGESQNFTKSLEVNYLSLTEELDGVTDVGVICKSKDVIVGDAGLLFGSQILGKIRDDVSFDSDVLHVEGNAGCGDGIQPRGVIHKVGGEGTVLDLLLREIAGKLVQNGGDHFHVREFFCTDRSRKLREFCIFSFIFDILQIKRMTEDGERIYEACGGVLPCFYG